MVIPTMWLAQGFVTALESYVKHPKINKIIIIDNNKKLRPSALVLNHDKIDLINCGRNIFVNPAWNEGHTRVTADIMAIANDDIIVGDSVFDMVEAFNLKIGDIIGVNLRGYQNNYRIDEIIDTDEKIVLLNYNRKQPIGGHAWAFGICMFMRPESYHKIPSLYQVWYGDDYLTQRSKNVYAINSNCIKGNISETLTKFDDPNSDISRRIELDSKNLLQYNHFENAKNWDIPQNMIRGYQEKRNLISDDIFAREYQLARSRASDINENVDILYNLARECKTVVEFGVRTGVSTRAFLNTNVELLSFDIVLDPGVIELFKKAALMKKNVKYIQANVLDIEVDPMDLLFIDTLHTYEQLAQELALHGNKAQRYIAFHDTYTFGLRGEDGRDRRGLLTAIIEFQIKNPHWRFRIHKTNNNGFTVLERHPQGPK